MEEWKPVPGLETMYAVSSLGRVKSLARTYTFRRKLNNEIVAPVTRTRKEKVLKASLGSNGHLTVRLNGKTASVHQLVLKIFRGPRPDGMVACHDDGRKTNNALTNLAWGTPSSNQLDRYRHEIDPFARGKDGRVLPGKRQKQEVNHV